MTTTPEPVTAHDLAEALRGATEALSVISIEWGLDAAVEDDNARWVTLLERWGAQVRKRMATAQATRDVCIANAELARRQDATISASMEVANARQANHEALRLRRELRALGGD